MSPSTASAGKLGATEAGLADRRRPGRQSAAPALLPLLRHRPAPDSGPKAIAPKADTRQPNAARGLCVGLLISLPLWALIILALRALL